MKYQIIDLQNQMATINTGQPLLNKVAISLAYIQNFVNARLSQPKWSQRSVSRFLKQLSGEETEPDALGRLRYPAISNQEKSLFTDLSRFRMYGSNRTVYVRSPAGEIMTLQCVKQTVKLGGVNIYLGVFCLLWCWTPDH